MGGAQTKRGMSEIGQSSENERSLSRRSYASNTHSVNWSPEPAGLPERIAREAAFASVVG